MTRCFFICLFFSLFAMESMAQSYKNNVVTDPSISRRCRELLEKRNNKVSQKQKINALIIRNQRLQKGAPKERQSVIKKLEKNMRHLKQELKITQMKIQHQEEGIIRQGCPGIFL